MMKREKVETLKRARLTVSFVIAAMAALMEGFFKWPGFHNRWASAILAGGFIGMVAYSTLDILTSGEHWLCAPSYLCRYCPMCGEELELASARSNLMVHKGSHTTIEECVPLAVARLRGTLGPR
jgi:hypothetical protein